jgi:hypothetical protein
MSIRVLITDDHNVVRKGIRDLLSDEDDIDFFFIENSFIRKRALRERSAGMPGMRVPGWPTPRQEQSRQPK